MMKLETALDNINLISGEAADSTKNLKALRNEIDAVITAIGDLVVEVDRKIPFRTKPEIKLP